MTLNDYIPPWYRRIRKLEADLARERAARTAAEVACWEMEQAFATAVHQAIESERERMKALHQAQEVTHGL